MISHQTQERQGKMKRKILYILADLADRAVALAAVCTLAALYIAVGTVKIITAKPLRARREPLITTWARAIKGPTIIGLSREAYRYGK